MSPLDQRGSSPTGTIQERLKNIHHRIVEAAGKSGRSPEAIGLVAVTKKVGLAQIQEALSLGIRDIAESRIQEAEEKWSGLKSQSVTHHFIGHLQTNKAKRAAQLFDLIQSIDSPKLAVALDRTSTEAGKKQRCLIEVKVSTEQTKTGVPLSEASQFIQSFDQYKNLQLDGLMMMAPHLLPPDATRACFGSFKKFFDSEKKYFGERMILSMGMSDDFEIAVEEGSTLVRVGRALFGER